MKRYGLVALVAVAASGAIVLARRTRHVASGRMVAGGILMSDAAGYDRLSRLIFGGLFRGIAADVVATAPVGAKVLEVGCGPGLLSVRLAGTHGLDVTGLDLDPAMIERAQANAARSPAGDGPSPTFMVGDVGMLPFPDGSFDLVVSTFSMHHWSDPMAGLTEIGRVLRPGGQALIWDLAPRRMPFHPPMHEHPAVPADMTLGSPRITPWHWPARLALAQRMEFTRD